MTTDQEPSIITAEIILHGLRYKTEPSADDYAYDFHLSGEWFVIQFQSASNENTVKSLDLKKEKCRRKTDS